MVVYPCTQFSSYQEASLTKLSFRAIPAFTLKMLDLGNHNSLSTNKMPYRIFIDNYKIISQWTEQFAERVIPQPLLRCNCSYRVSRINIQIQSGYWVVNLWMVFPVKYRRGANSSVPETIILTLRMPTRSKRCKFTHILAYNYGPSQKEITTKSLHEFHLVAISPQL